MSRGTLFWGIVVGGGNRAMEKMKSGLNRREFAGLVPALLAIAGALTGTAEGQAPAPATGPAAAGPRPMKELSSGVFKPIAGKGMVGGHESHQFLAGMLAAGNIRLE